jgi:hypothetical protein
MNTSRNSTSFSVDKTGTYYLAVISSANAAFRCKWFCRYFLNVIFNILNKKIYNYFPYP